MTKYLGQHLTLFNSKPSKLIFIHLSDCTFTVGPSVWHRSLLCNNNAWHTKDTGKRMNPTLEPNDFPSPNHLGQGLELLLQISSCAAQLWPQHSTTDGGQKPHDLSRMADMQIFVVATCQPAIHPYVAFTLACSGWLKFSLYNMPFRETSRCRPLPNRLWNVNIVQRSN